MAETCYWCHKKLTEKDRYSILGKNLLACESCALDRYEKCDLCGQYACSNDLKYVEDKNVCLWCLSEKYVLCPHCGDFFSLSNAVKFHGIYMCRECRKEYYEECEICHKSVETDELTDVNGNGDNRRVCPECLKAQFFTCDDCEEIFPREQLHHFDDKDLCRECMENYLEECDICHQHVEEEKLADVVVGGQYQRACPECLKNKFAACTNCGQFFPHAELHRFEGEKLCPSCLREVEEAMQEAAAQEAEAAGIAAAATMLGMAILGGHSHNAPTVASDDNDAYWDDGYPDDYVGDGLDGTDDYVGDGLD